MAGKRASARAAALVAAVLMVSAFTAPAAFADDTTVDPTAPVAEESLVVDAPVVNNTPVVDDTTDTDTGDDQGTANTDSTQSTPSSTPETDADNTDTNTDAPADVVAPVVTTPAVEEDAETPDFVPTASIASITAGGYEFAGSREISSSGTVQTNITADNPLYAVSVQVTTCLGNPSALVLVNEQNAFNVNFRHPYPDGSCVVSAQAFINGSPAGEPMSTTVVFSTKQPVAQVASISATAVEGNDARTINVSGTVSLTDIDDPSIVLVVLSYGDNLVSAPLVIDADGNYSTVLTGEFPDGVYTISAQAYLQQSHEVVPSGTSKSTQVEFKTPETPVKEFTPPQPTFEALACVDGAPQTRVTFPAVDPKKGYYYTNGESEIALSGTVVLEGQIRLGFQFAQGFEPPYSWSGLTGFTPEKCAVVVPPVVVPPVVTPPPATTPVPPADNGGHKTPTKVETDGDSSLLLWGAALALGVAVLTGRGALRLVTARRGSASQ